jgi:aminoglycoside 6'-N-acetyltransferase
MTELRGERVLLRPMTAEDAPALRAIRATPEVAAWWQEAEAEWPLEDEPDVTRWTVVIADDVAGLVEIGEEPDPDYRYASIDVFLAPQHHGIGLGADVVATAIRYLIDDRGHHRLTIDPAADNAVAIRCYEKAGFKPVGVMRAHWRDRSTGQWRDGLLMELVVDAVVNS